MKSAPECGVYIELRKGDSGSRVKEMQEQLWADMPWIPLVTEKNIAASAKNLTGFYIQPDGGYNFYQAELK